MIYTPRILEYNEIVDGHCGGAANGPGPQWRSRPTEEDQYEKVYRYVVVVSRSAVVKKKYNKKLYYIR